MNTMKTSISSRWLLAIAAILFASAAGSSSAKAATSTTKAVHAFLQGGDYDAELPSQDAPERDLRVNVWHDREDDDTYRLGEAINVNFRTNADMYVVVYRLDTDGQVEVLWPTTRYDDGFVYGNHTYTLPRPGSPIRLNASELRGVEYVEAIASEYPFDLRSLAIDFRFDSDARGDYNYVVSGDPFLAVNDINFAITGLEADVEYIVTDWAHIYVESKVEYARYACRQCHDQSENDYKPYVDKCTTVNIYNDWGWQTNWYDSFGWYPLYYEPPYYYWDIGFSRPYWYSYYPLVYSWPSYGVYSRPYPVYWWYDSPYDYVDYRTRYKKNWRNYRPLYDLDSSRVRRASRDLDSTRSVNRSPASMRNGVRGRGVESSVDRSRLVRNRMGDRAHRGEVGSTVSTRRGGSRLTDRGARGRSGVRTDLSRRSESRRLRSLSGVRSDERSRVSPDRGERRWTRPVIRNREQGSRDRSGSEVKRDRGRNRDRKGTEVKRDRGRKRDRSGSEVKGDRGRKRDRSGSEAKRDRASSGKRGREVKPPSRGSSKSGGQKARPTKRGGNSRGGDQKVAPSRGSRSSSKSSQPKRSSGGRGSRSKGGKRGGRGG